MKERTIVQKDHDRTLFSQGRFPIRVHFLFPKLQLKLKPTFEKEYNLVSFLISARQGL